MEAEIHDDEVSSDTDSNFTTRPSTADSLDMPKVSLQSGRNSTAQGRSSTADSSPPPAKQLKEEKSIKVLVFNGKCSKVFKSTLEECVEDCILEFPDDKNSIYVPKSGPAIPVPTGSNRNSLASLRESSAGGRLSSRSNRRRNMSSLPATALAVTTAVRMRHQLVQQRFALEDDISEESTDQQTMIEPLPFTTNIESEEQSKRPSPLPDQSSPRHIASSSLPLFPSAKSFMSYRDRQREYRLSDLVMFGPEYFAHVFNLPRNRPRSRQTGEKLTESDRIKQDLFHRYLWTQNPQVSSRIRPMTSYSRSSTFVI